MSPAGSLIEALKQVEDPLALLTGIFFHAPVAFQVYRADGTSLVTNPEFRRMFGSEPPPDYNVLRDEIAEKTGVLDRIRRAFQGETIHTPPIWYDARELQQVKVTEGRRVAIEATFFPLFGRDDRIEHVGIVFKDVTTERTLREDAERERDLLSLVIDQSGNGIVIVDRSGTVRRFNAEAERQHGVPLREVGPEDWVSAYGLSTPEGRPLAVEETPLFRALKGEQVRHARWCVRRPDGSILTLGGSASPLRTADGTLSGAVLVTQDETDQLADERRLRFQATVLDNVRDSIVVTDLDGKIVQWNRGAELVFGYSPAEALGRTPSFLYPDISEAELARDLASIADGRDFVGEWRGQRKDGTTVWVEIKTTLMRDVEGNVLGYIGIGKDVSDRKRAEAERQHADARREEALRMAEAASRAKDEFLAMLGHELRNPLSPIVTALQLMKLKGDARSTKEQQVIERQVDHLVRLVDDLLDISRITRGKVDLKKARVDLNEAIAQAIEMASPLLEQRRHHFQATVPRSGMKLEGDLARLAQIVSNLLTNAAKYTAPGGHVELRAWREGDEIVLSVKDDGIGIEPELLPHVFDLFVQGQRSSDRAEGGLGIGLTLVHNLVHMHHGSIHAFSEGRGRGSEFVVRLPALNASQGSDFPERPSRQLAPALRARRVLVVDDNVDAAVLVAELLRAAGHDVAVAHDGAAALATVRRFRPEVAILDIGLPVMDGYELARRLRDSLGEMLHLIAMTGYGQDYDRVKSTEAGFDDFLVKPVVPQHLLARIDDAAAVQGSER